ncbi:MAG: alkaline phosphatase family protein [Terriglobia bacterium]
MRGPHPASRLVVLSVDGMHPNFYRRAQDLGLELPNILNLMESGASADGVESVYPSTTYPAHATLVTGVPPRGHGIYSHFASLDPTEPARPWHWFAQALDVPAIWTVARVEGLKTAAVSWPVSVGAPIHYNLPEIWNPAAAKPHEDFQTVAQHSTPGLYDELLRVLGPTLGHTKPDRLRAEAALYLIKKYRPDFLLIHFVEYDFQAHRFGPVSREALNALEETDREIGRLREASGAPGEVTIVVLSDHGFVPVEKEIAPLVVLAEEGLFGKHGARKPELQKLGAVQAGGSFALYWLEEPSTLDRQALDRAVTKLRKSGGISEVVDRNTLELLGADPDAELMLDAAPGYCFSDRFRGALIEKSATDRGTHGNLPTLAGLEASFIVAGPRVAPGKNLGRITLTDIAPTLMSCLGFPPDMLAGENAPLKLT